MIGIKFGLTTLFTTLVVWSSAWADQGDQYRMEHMMGNMGAWGWGGMIFAPIMMIVFIAVAVAVGVLLVRWLGGPGHGGELHNPSVKTPLDILKERFAKGEIDNKEFEERRCVLEA